MDMEAVSDEWVQFNCTVTSVNCNYTVWWFIAGYPSPIKRNNTVPGLITRRTFSRCTSSNQTTHFFEVLANKELDRAVFYCGAQLQGFRGRQAPRSCRCVDGRCYSKPALLTSKSFWNMNMLFFFILIITAGNTSKCTLYSISMQLILLLLHQNLLV